MPVHKFFSAETSAPMNPMCHCVMRQDVFYFLVDKCREFFLLYLLQAMKLNFPDVNERWQRLCEKQNSHRRTAQEAPAAVKMYLTIFFDSSCVVGWIPLPMTTRTWGVTLFFIAVRTCVDRCDFRSSTFGQFNELTPIEIKILWPLPP